MYFQEGMKNKMSKLIVVDGNSIANRAFYGIMGGKMLQTADGTYTYEQNIHYKLVEGSKDILIVLTGILKETKIIVNSEEGFGKAKQSGKVSPSNTLELTVN